MNGSSPSSSITYCGSVSLPTCFAFVNRLLVRGLRAAGYSVRQVDCVEEAAAAEDTVIVFDFMAHFGRIQRPARCRHFIAIRTWDFGPYPPAWRDKINETCDQVWVFCEWVRKLAIASGIRSELIHVVPPGYDETVFTPEGPRYPLATRKRFKFLFVGGAVFRKGLDILLRAYAEEFQATEDVCLVIHAQQDDPFYKNAELLERIQTLSAGSGPEIMLHRQFLNTQELAAFYRACDVGVFPYRAEGFAIPIVEGLAVGLTPIVPRFGASLDYCTQENSFQIPARRIALPVRDSFVTNAFGFRERIEAVDFCETDPSVLAVAMRRAYVMPVEELRRRSETAALSVANGFTQRDTIAAAVRALEALQSARIR